MTMRLHRILNAVVIMLLLYAQQAAYAHAVSHLGKEAPAKEQLAHSKLCDKCLSFEKIAGMAPASVPMLAGPELRFAERSQHEYRFAARTIAVFHSRAPPYFL